MKKIPAIILSVSRSNVFSSRSLKTLGGKTVFEHIKDRLERSKYVGRIILCTSDESADNPLVELADSVGVSSVRGEYDNILSRLLNTYSELGTDSAFIVRGDTPLIDSVFCDRLYEYHSENGFDFSFNEHLFGIPYGLGCEIMNLDVLKKMSSSDMKCDTQRFSLFVKIHEDMFKNGKLEFDKPDPDLRLVLETPSDLEFLRELISLGGEDLDAYGILDIVKKHPFLRDINKPVSDVKEIGLDKLLLFPNKIDAILNDKGKSMYPVSVELTLTNNCNLNCKWCSDKDLRSNRPGTLPFEVCYRLVGDLAENGCRGLVIEGGGEPTIYPRFREVVDSATEKGLAVGLITNGIVFNYSDLLPKMEWVRVSLDADSRETFSEWKGKDAFYDVLGNIRKMCENAGDCVIGVGYVVTMHNIKYLEEITMLLYEYGVNYLYLRPVIDNPDMSISENLFYLKKYETDSFSVMIHAMDENVIAGNDGLPCVSHPLSCVIAGDGSVFLCGRLNIHDWFEPLGNLNDNSFYEIWNGEKRKEQVGMVKDASFCEKWCPECRLTKYNKVFSNISKIKTRNFI